MNDLFIYVEENRRRLETIEENNQQTRFIQLRREILKYI